MVNDGFLDLLQDAKDFYNISWYCHIKSKTVLSNNLLQSRKCKRLTAYDLFCLPGFFSMLVIGCLLSEDPSLLTISLLYGPDVGTHLIVDVPCCKICCLGGASTVENNGCHRVSDELIVILLFCLDDASAQVLFLYWEEIRNMSLSKKAKSQRVALTTAYQQRECPN